MFWSLGMAVADSSASTGEAATPDDSIPEMQIVHGSTAV